MPGTSLVSDMQCRVGYSRAMGIFRVLMSYCIHTVRRLDFSRRTGFNYCWCHEGFGVYGIGWMVLVFCSGV